jgi:hypothetical protein
MTGDEKKCPLCGSETTYVGAIDVECRGISCRNFNGEDLSRPNFIYWHKYSDGMRLPFPVTIKFKISKNKKTPNGVIP